MFRLIPVIDFSAVSHDFKWAELPPGEDWIALGPTCSDADVRNVVAALASYSGDCRSGAMADAAKAAEMAEGLILPGGLRAEASGQSISPSCCCGLEGWREWFAVAPGGPSPWLGHDPSPFVETRPDQAIIWPDYEAEGSAPCLTVPYDDIEQACEAARKELLGFAQRLTEWLERYTPANTGLAHRFREQFDVS